MGKSKDKANKKNQHGGGGGGKNAAKQDKASERQERARLRKDRQRNNNHGYYRSDEDDRQFETQMEQIGCRIHFMAGDGNCLFRSLGDQVEGKPEDHAEIRAQIMNHLADNKEVFEPYMEDDEPFDDYIDRMRGDAEWGGNQELVAASQLYKANVVVHQFQAPRFFIPFEKARRTIHLSYHGEHHYNSVRAIGDEGRGPAMPITLNTSGTGKSPGSAAAKGAGKAKSPWPLQEEAVAQSCPWAESSSIVDALHATGGREDDAIELLIAAQNESAQLDAESGSNSHEKAKAAEGGGNAAGVGKGKNARTGTTGGSTSKENGSAAYAHQSHSPGNPDGENSGAGGLSVGSGDAQNGTGRTTYGAATAANGRDGVTSASGEGVGDDGTGVSADGVAAPKHGTNGKKMHQTKNGAPLSSGSVDSAAAGHKKGLVKKVTRGSDCPCGSGLKYKKCCRKKDAAIARGQVPAGKTGEVDDAAFADDLGSLVI